MIKKILLTLIAVVGMSAMAMAGDTYTRDASVLPKAAQDAIERNFKAKVNIVKVEKELGRVTEYEVVLTDGSEISFDSKGNWDNVEVGASSTVPSAFIPAEISTYVKKNHKGERIVGIDKERGGYEVELSNGIEIKFNKEGRFVRYDD